MDFQKSHGLNLTYSRSLSLRMEWHSTLKFQFSEYSSFFSSCDW